MKKASLTCCCGFFRFLQDNLFILKQAKPNNMSFLCNLGKPHMTYETQNTTLFQSCLCKTPPSSNLVSVSQAEKRIVPLELLIVNP